eukprot:jgi/Mesvir1/625/Mv22173-RA.1
MEFRTVQGSSIKMLVEVLKELTNDVNFFFDQKGVRIVSFDLAHCALFHAFLEASKIEEYKCNKQYTIGISLVNLFKLLKNVTVNDELELRLDDANLDVLQITILNRVKNTRWTYEMKLMDIDEEMIEIPEKEYMTCITMVSSEFQKICRDISIVADKVRIECGGDNIVLSGSGDIGNCQLEIGKNHPEMTLNAVNGDRIDETYSVRYLCTFSKASGLCNTVDIFIMPEYPMIVKYKIGDLGSLMFALAPQSITGVEQAVILDGRKLHFDSASINSSWTVLQTLADQPFLDCLREGERRLFVLLFDRRPLVFEECDLDELAVLCFGPDARLGRHRFSALNRVTAELPKTEPPKTEVVVSDPDPPKTDADVNMEDSGGDSDDSGKKRKRAPIMSTSIPDMSVGDVRKTLNELRKLGASATVDHKLHNGWTAGDFCLKYVLGSYTPQ